MTTFTFPVTMTFTASIDADHEGEARLTIQRDLNEIAADEVGNAFTTDNGVAMQMVSAEVAQGIDSDVMMAALLKFAVHPLPFCETDEEKLARLDEFMKIVRSDSRAALATTCAIAREMLCTACGRVSEDCSAEPCAAVIADREA